MPSLAYSSISVRKPLTSPSGSTRPMIVFWMASWSRPSASQCARSTSSLWLTSATDEPKRLQASAYFATSRRVFFSPPPPMRIGGRGDCSGWGARDADRLRKLVVLAFEGAVVVAPHLVADLQRLFKPLEPLGYRRIRHAE